MLYNQPQDTNHIYSISYWISEFQDEIANQYSPCNFPNFLPGQGMGHLNLVQDPESALKTTSPEMDASWLDQKISPAISLKSLSDKAKDSDIEMIKKWAAC